MRAQTGPNQRHQNGVNLPRGRHLFLPDRLRCIRRGQIDDHGPLFLCLERFLRHEYPSLPKGEFFCFFCGRIIAGFDGERLEIRDFGPGAQRGIDAS